MARKSFQTAAPREIQEFDINGEVFRLNPAIPGAVLLDFIADADEEDSAKMATTIREFLSTAVLTEDQERFWKFVRDPGNNVSLSVLAEVAGYVAEAMSGNDQSPGTSGPG